MNYQSYEDYMRSVLGNSDVNEYTNVPTYSTTNAQNVSNFRNVNIPNSMNISQMNMPIQTNMPKQANFQNSMKENLESDMVESEEILRIQRMYPDIYCLLMPMVNKIVEENKERDITDNLIESMTMEIYSNIEDDMVVNRNTQSQQNSRANNLQSNNSVTSKTTSSQTNNATTQLAQTGNIQRQSTQLNNTTGNTVSNTIQNSRKIGNPTLKDLIKILIIRRLLELKKNTRRDSVVDNRFCRPVNQSLGMNYNYIPTMNQYSVMQRTNMQNPPIQSSPMQNMNRINYPFTNYFATPYPEDEYVN